MDSFVGGTIWLFHQKEKENIFTKTKPIIGQLEKTVREFFGSISFPMIRKPIWKG